MRPSAPLLWLRGLAGLASCTALSLALAGEKSAIVVSLDEAAAASSVVDLASSDAGEAAVSSRSSRGAALGSDLAESVGEIGAGMAAAAGSWAFPLFL